MGLFIITEQIGSTRGGCVHKKWIFFVTINSVSLVKIDQGCLDSSSTGPQISSHVSITKDIDNNTTVDDNHT